jgi:hypothetical protein
MNLFQRQSDAQRFLLRMTPKGFWWWVGGVAADRVKLDRLSSKFAEHYGTDLKPHQRSWRRKKGLANCHLVSAPTSPNELDGGYRWYLISTDGLGPIRENGKLKDARTNPGRVVWNDYVLYESQRHRLEGGGMRWSWHIKPDVQKQLDHHVGQLLKTAPQELPTFLEMQTRRPLHHGIRMYLTRLIRRAHQNFGRMYPGKEWRGWDPSKPLPSFGQYKKNELEGGE